MKANTAATRILRIQGDQVKGHLGNNDDEKYNFHTSLPEINRRRM
jgi:hypothetical protein